jgi:MFS family permease
VYLTSRAKAAVLVDDDPASAPPPAVRRRVAPNVLALGAVSLVTDISSEMVTAILPLYFVFVLGMTPLQFGFFDGLYSGVTSFVQLFAGVAADRWQRRKAIAGAGYGLSAICKLGMLLAGSSLPGIGLVLAADRTGKGIRTAPRDALISLSSREEDLGRSFGVHRALDTAGAFIGPLLAFIMISAAPDGYDAIFVVSFCVAAFAVGILVVTVRDKRSAIASHREVSARAAMRLLKEWRFSAITICAALFSFVQISDAFVYLILQRRYDFQLSFFPLLSLGTSAGYLLLAVPMGRVADRVGRARVFLLGHVALLVVYVLAEHGPKGWPFLIVILAIHGSFYAATDGVLMAYVGPIIPAQLRTSGMAVIQTGNAVANLASSTVFGLAWTLWGPSTAVVVFGAALVASLVLGAAILPIRSRA